MLGIINRNFVDIDEKTFLLLYKAMVRSHLEFAGSVWSPYKINQIRSLEKYKNSYKTSKILQDLVIQRKTNSFKIANFKV